MPRVAEWFWATLKKEGLRFRRDYTPYQCELCKGNWAEDLALTKRHLALLTNRRDCELRRNLSFYDADLFQEIAELAGKKRKLEKALRNQEMHEIQVKIQRKHNIDEVDDWLLAKPGRVKVTEDYGASYFITGGRYVCHKIRQT